MRILWRHRNRRGWRIDHRSFLPQTKGGTDILENLLYCCYRCNQYKADYWPTQPSEPHLWHPQHEPIERHLLLLADGTLRPITTEVGAFTLQRLRLNRPPLVALRLRKQRETLEHRLLARYHDLVAVLAQLHRQQFALLEEQQALLADSGGWCNYCYSSEPNGDNVTTKKNTASSPCCWGRRCGCGSSFLRTNIDQ